MAETDFSTRDEEIQPSAVCGRVYGMEGGSMIQTESYVPFDGGNLWTCANDAESALPVLLCNGGPGCCDYLEPVAEMLDSYRVIRFEQRGCGRSTADGRYDLMTAVEDIERIRKYYGIDRWIVGGHSWGANLAFVYAMTYPEQASALLYISGNGIQNDRAWSEEYHRNRNEQGEVMPEMAYAGNDEVNREGNRTLREFGRSPDFWQRVSKMDTPALFVAAEKDIRPSWPAEQLARLIPNAQFVMVKKAAHYLWLDNADGLRQVLSEFLQEVTTDA